MGTLAITHMEQEGQLQHHNQQHLEAAPRIPTSVVVGGEGASNPLAEICLVDRLVQLVRLPADVNRNHWLSAHTIDFYHLANVLYGAVSDFCTSSSCPVMGCFNKFEYHWKDPQSVDYKRSTRVSAPCYIQLLMQWVDRQVTDDSVFPNDATNKPYPDNFEELVKNIFKRLFRVYAHLYSSHFSCVQALQTDGHLNTSFKHFMLFSLEFQLIPAAELRPLHALLINLLGEDVVSRLQSG